MSMWPRALLSRQVRSHRDNSSPTSKPIRSRIAAARCWAKALSLTKGLREPLTAQSDLHKAPCISPCRRTTKAVLNLAPRASGQHLTWGVSGPIQNRFIQPSAFHGFCAEASVVGAALLTCCCSLIGLPWSSSWLPLLSMRLPWSSIGLPRLSMPTPSG
jgi:hypothetical protein